jgi:hypothetical protein
VRPLVGGHAHLLRPGQWPESVMRSFRHSPNTFRRSSTSAEPRPQRAAQVRPDMLPLTSLVSDIILRLYPARVCRRMAANSAGVGDDGRSPRGGMCPAPASSGTSCRALPATYRMSPHLHRACG